MTKIKRGRPPMPTGEARNYLFRLRLRRSEMDIIARRATRAGQAMHDWVRARLLA